MRAWIRDNVPIVVASLVLGAVLLLMAGSQYGFDRLHCLFRHSHPSTWDNPPAFWAAKDVEVRQVDRLEEGPGLLQREDGPVLLHRVIMYRVEMEYDDEFRTFLAQSLKGDCWSFQYAYVPGVHGLDTGDYRYAWPISPEPDTEYYFDTVLRWSALMSK